MSRALDSATRPSPAGLTALPSPISTATLIIGVGTPLATSESTRVAINPSSIQWSVVSDRVNTQAGSSRTLMVGRPRTSLVLDSALDELASDSVFVRGQEEGGSIRELARAAAGAAGTSVLVNPTPSDDPSHDSDGPSAGLSNVLMAAGLVGLGGLVAAKNPKGRSRSSQKRSHTFGPRIR
jgi:hypothetical protein